MNAQKKKLNVTRLLILKLALKLLFICGYLSSNAQCPPNLDFEEGTFNNWQCLSGSFQGGVINMSPTVPTAGRHDMMTIPPGNGRDFYGNFPKNCPNGSGSSARIGVETTGKFADAVEYTFTIPAGQNTYNLIYHYALVLNDAGHSPQDQPRMLVTVENITDNTPLPCPFDPIIVTGNLPGFFRSPNNGPGNTAVWCKSWAASSIKLDNLAGKTIRLTFTVTGCGLSGGTHFGYAYVDVNSTCSSAFDGATYCPDDTAISITAPYGYQGYRWWDINDPSTILATTQVINFNPPPPSGTVLQVEVTPYAGYGCTDIFTAYLWDTLTVISDAGPDRVSCQNAPVQLGIPGNPSWTYSWSPVTGLSDPNISNPIATPNVTTEYVLTVTNSGGGCVTTDTVLVSAAVLSNNMTVTGPTTGCIQGSQPTILEVPPADSVQWYRDGVAIPGATSPQYNVLIGGSYHATVFSYVGCNLSTNPILIDVKPAPVVGFTNNTASQCFNNHQFDFTNTSTIVTGSLTYEWSMGDGTTYTTRDVTHSYAVPGTYLVELIVTSDLGCKDTTETTVYVNDDPQAGFSVNTDAQCLRNNSFVFTNSSTIAAGTLQYNWDMGDGNTYTTTDVTHSYLNAGTYTVRLTVTSDKGCVDDSVFNVRVTDAPLAGFSTANPQQCFGGNQFDFINSTTLAVGTLEYLWTLGDGNTATTRDVSHSYAAPGDYTVKMVATSDNGCADSVTLNVKVFGYATADFYVEPACVNMRLPLTNKTMNTSNSPLSYLWDFGNGQTSTQVTPVYSYPAPGNYTIKLSVSSAACPLTVSEKVLDVVIDAPATPIRYADETAVMNFPEQLQARQLGTSVLWMPSLHLDNPTSYTPYFKGLTEQLYTIRHKSATGCITVDTQLVKIRKKIEIYVPTTFTPNNDGRNEHLRPYLMGFTKVNYFRVYNRWGKLLYQMQSDLPGWDGRINGQVQEIQTVVWMIEAVDVDGNVHQRKGTSILLR